MDPTPCTVLDGDDRWPGQVLLWVHDHNGWHGVVRYVRTWPQGWRMSYEHAAPASQLEPA